MNILFNAYIEIFLITGVFTALISKELQLKTCKLLALFFENEPLLFENTL